jgi:CPA2 family monovalent cation:H+ antiporter-2
MSPAERERIEEEARRRPASMTDHTVLVGYGRVGSVIGAALKKAAVPFVVIEDADRVASHLHSEGIEIIHGNAAAPDVIRAANLAAAHQLIVAIPNAFEAGQIIRAARDANAGLSIVARAHSEDEAEYLRQHGADTIILAEREVAKGFVREVLPEPAAREV